MESLSFNLVFNKSIRLYEFKEDFNFQKQQLDLLAKIFLKILLQTFEKRKTNSQ